MIDYLFCFVVLFTEKLLVFVCLFFCFDHKIRLVYVCAFSKKIIDLRCLLYFALLAFGTLCLARKCNSTSL